MQLRLAVIIISTSRRYVVVDTDRVREALQTAVDEMLS
jgi:hypothetical protein